MTGVQEHDIIALRRQDDYQRITSAEFFEPFRQRRCSEHRRRRAGKKAMVSRHYLLSCL
jgi:hypothetical protein